MTEHRDFSKERQEAVARMIERLRRRNAGMSSRDAICDACTPHWRTVRRVLEQAWRETGSPMASIRAGLWDAIGHGEIEIDLSNAKVRRAVKVTPDAPTTTPEPRRRLRLVPHDGHGHAVSDCPDQ